MKRERKTKKEVKLPKEVKPATLTELEGQLAGVESRHEQIVRAVTEAVRNLSYHSTDHGPAEVQKIVRKMMKWVPEAAPAETIEAMRSNKDWYTEGDEDNPFFGSQSWIYPLLGKEDGRTFFAFLHGLMRAAGVNPDSFEGEANSQRRESEEYSEYASDRIENQVATHKKLLRGELVPDAGLGSNKYLYPKPCEGARHSWGA